MVRIEDPDGKREFYATSGAEGETEKGAPPSIWCSLKCQIADG